MKNYNEGIKILGDERIIIKDDFTEPFITREYLFTRIHEEIKAIMNYISLGSIEDVIKLYVENYDKYKCDSGEKTSLKPVEPIGKYYFKRYSDKILELIKDLKGYVIIGYDSSYYNPRGHFIIDFILNNIGYYYERIGYGQGGSGYHPYIALIGSAEYDQEIIIKELESQLLNHLLKHVRNRFRNDKIFLFLDESLNLSFTYSWSSDKRKRYGERMKEELLISLSQGVIPIGVFYTRAGDLVNGLECILSEQLPPLQDKHIFNRYLGRGARSQLFEVRSRVLEEVGLSIYAFYLKIDEGNVIRVEFPIKAVEINGFEVVDDIHRLIFFDSIRNNGYSYVLSRSHEAAVLRYSDREGIEHMITESLNIPLKYVYSRKESFKRRPIA